MQIMKDNDYANVKLCRKYFSASSETYKTKLEIFENGEPEEFLILSRTWRRLLGQQELSQ